MTMLCSSQCAKVWVMSGGELKQDEREAAVMGGQAAGEYLDSIGKSDLAKLSKEEWETFCQALFRGACAEMERRANDFVPF